MKNISLPNSKIFYIGYESVDLTGSFDENKRD
jgi:hypothetical protein